MPEPSVQASVLVTGATGFLGRHVLRALHATQQCAAVLTRGASWTAQPWRDEAADVSVIEGDVLTGKTLQCGPALDGIRTVLHAAALVRHSRAPSEDMTELNVNGTLQMVHLARHLRARLIFVSTSGTVGCYRFPDINADEDSPYADDMVANWPYYASKIRAEQEARRLADKLGVELVIVRPPVLLGPDDHRGRSTDYVRKVLLRKVPAIPPGSMHFADVRDVAAALARLATTESPRPIYHLPGSHLSLADFFELIAEISGVPVPRLRLGPIAIAALSKVGRSFRTLSHVVPDPVVLEMSTRHWGLSSLFAHEIGYQSRPARQTLADTIAWLQAPAVQVRMEERLVS